MFVTRTLTAIGWPGAARGVSVLSMFSFVVCGTVHRAQHSFPTRRSSDLPVAVTRAVSVLSHALGSAGVKLPVHVHDAPGSSELGHGVAVPDRKRTRLNSRY